MEILQTMRRELNSRMDSVIIRMDSRPSDRQLVDRQRSKSSRMPSPVFSPIRDVPRELSNTYPRQIFTSDLTLSITETSSVSSSVSTSVETSVLDCSGGCSGAVYHPYEEGEFEDICVQIYEHLDEQDNLLKSEEFSTPESSFGDHDTTSDGSDTASESSILCTDNRYDSVSDSDLMLSIPSYDEEGVEYYLSPSDSEEQEIKSHCSVSTSSSDQYYQYCYPDDDDENASFDDDCPEP
jgi:hypothetical protein